MAILDMDFTDVVEPHAVPADTEYQLRIIEVKEGKDRNGHEYLMPRFEVLDEVGSKDFTYFLGLPHDEMDAKRLNSCKHKIKKFMEAFEIENMDTESWIGATAWAILGVEETDQYGEQNFIKKFA